MGDVGALGLGAALALLALSTNTSLLLPLICLLNVIEIGSVALQMGSYRLFDKRRHLPHVADPPPLRADRAGRRRR